MQKYGKRPGLKRIDTGARKVSPTYGKAAFVTYVDKGGGVAVYENDSERLVSHMLGFDPRVRSFQAQPFAVDLVEGRLLRTADQRDAARRKYARRPGPSLYTPDFGVEFSSGRQRAVEVKLGGFIGAAPDHERQSQAAGVLRTYGYDFIRIVIPADLNHPLRSSITLLHHAALRPDLRPHPEMVAKVDELAERGAITLAAYARGLDISVNLIPTLIVHGILSMDLIAHRIEGRTPSAPAFGSLEHLELMERLEQ